METGKSEHMLKSIERVNKILKVEPDYLQGFYYFMHNSGKTESYRTHEKYVKYVVKFLKEIGKQPSEITMDDISMYLAKVSVKKDGSMVSGSYLVAIYSALKKFFKYMLSSKRLSEDPMEFIERPAPKKAELVTRTYLTKREIKKCFKEVDEDQSKWKLRNKALLIMFFFTGIRNTCLTEINVDNVDFENNCIYVLDKGSKPRTCFLSDDKMEVMKEWIIQREMLLEEKGKRDVKALFLNKYCERLQPIGSAYIIKTITKKIGHEISPHKARGSFATNSLNSGLSLYEVSKLMNHASTTVTAQCYIQGQDERIKEAGLKAASYMQF